MAVTIYAHSKGQSEDEWEPLVDHLAAVGEAAAERAAAFKAEDLARALGVLHDIGKIDPAFKARLRGEAVRVDHSTAGAVAAIDKYGARLGKMLA